MNHLARGLLAGIAAIALSGPASALTYIFTLGGEDGGIPLNATWRLPSSPTPDQVPIGGFRLFDVDMVVNGSPAIAQHSYGSMGFQSLGFLVGAKSYDFGGPPLFTGTNAAPTFKTGTFTLFSEDGRSTLTIAAIPEPASWGLMIAGFGAVGFALRRRNPALA
jgi:hypothetical protein